MRKWITTVRGKRIAFTGRAWLTRAALRRQVLRKRGIPTPGAAVTSTTTILFRGDSSVWAFGEYGTKEREAAKFIRKGASISLIHDFEFRKVLENGRPARVADRIAGEPVLWLAPVTKRQFYRLLLKKGRLIESTRFSDDWNKVIFAMLSSERPSWQFALCVVAVCQLDYLLPLT